MSKLSDTYEFKCDKNGYLIFSVFGKLTIGESDEINFSRKWGRKCTFRGIKKWGKADNPGNSCGCGWEAWLQKSREFFATLFFNMDNCRMIDNTQQRGEIAYRNKKKKKENKVNKRNPWVAKAERM